MLDYLYIHKYRLSYFKLITLEQSYFLYTGNRYTFIRKSMQLPCVVHTNYFLIIGNLSGNCWNSQESPLAYRCQPYTLYSYYLKHYCKRVQKIQHEEVCWEINTTRGKANYCTDFETHPQVLHFSYMWAQTVL